MKKHGSKRDIGLMWAKYVNIWGQVGTVVGTINFVMLLGVFYTTTIRASGIPVPLWLYILVVVVGAAIGITFVIKIGISGYYRFFSKQSEVAETNRRVKMIMNHLGIKDDDVC